MATVKITADSTCDLSPALVERFDIQISPLYIEMGDQSLRDGVEIQSDQVCQYYEQTGKLAKTSAVPVSDYLEMFGPYVRQGREIVHFTISSEMSACYQNACIAGKELGHVYVVDTRHLSVGIGILALKASEMAAQGRTGKEIFDAVTAMIPRVRTSFVIDTLEFLAKGGRCSSVLALGANLLKLKPCVELENGEMHVGKKYRGNIGKVMPQYVHDKLAGPEKIDPERVFVVHTSCAQETIDQVMQVVRDCGPFDEVLECVAGGTITCHCGRNTLGVIYMVQE